MTGDDGWKWKCKPEAERFEYSSSYLLEYLWQPYLCACVRVFVYAKCTEDEVMSRIHDAEHSQLVEEMRRRIAELEIEVRVFF